RLLRGQAAEAQPLHHRTVLPRRLLSPARTVPVPPRPREVGQGVRRAGGPADGGAGWRADGTSGRGCGVVSGGHFARRSERRSRLCPRSVADDSAPGEGMSKKKPKVPVEQVRAWIPWTLLGLALVETGLSIFQWHELRVVQAGGSTVCSINIA